MNTLKQQSNIHEPGTWDAVASVRILGVRIHRITMDQTLAVVESMIDRRDPQQIVTVNPEFVMTALKNDAFRNTLNNAALAVPDGIGVVLASRLTSTPITTRVTGVDLVEGIAGIASRKKLRLFFLGAMPGVAEQAAIRLLNRHPGFVIAGCYAGSPKPNEEDDICRRILATSPDVLFVAYGAPNQDLWIARNLKRLNVPVAIGIGGTFDFIAGMAKRAPGWVQSMGMEWLHRLVSEPKRWRRMLALPKFAALVVKDKFLPTATA
jgi:N-acetylglucosaminyldiphosphoundecaprenol N-acetyl-beta-D-mannosaminyltransferase